jgi:hypothetical protein
MTLPCNLFWINALWQSCIIDPVNAIIYSALLNCVIMSEKVYLFSKIIESNSSITNVVSSTTKSTSGMIGFNKSSKVQKQIH